MCQSCGLMLTCGNTEKMSIKIRANVEIRSNREIRADTEIRSDRDKSLYREIRAVREIRADKVESMVNLCYDVEIFALLALFHNLFPVIKLYSFQ